MSRGTGRDDPVPSRPVPSRIIRPENHHYRLGARAGAAEVAQEEGGAQHRLHQRVRGGRRERRLALRRLAGFGGCLK